jgi:osmoprotectant transport system permease protein
VNPFQYIAENWDSLGPQVLTHVFIVVVCMAAASAIGIALGIAAARWQRLGTVILAATSTIITVPSFALFGLLSIWLGWRTRR